ncbi:MAG: tetratricopeptide repeat protein [Cocleimonas sp.]|nr:tetratricopeptide repeat protein [Cocleimonas sp.]
MLNISIKSIGIGLVLFTLIQGAIACGPYLPEHLLVDRKAALLKGVTGDFHTDIYQIIPKKKGTLVPVENTTREMLEKKEFPLDTFNLLQKIRKEAINGEMAYLMGSRLPETIRIYTAGAVSYHAKGYSEAIKYFETLLSTPKKDKEKTVWARYMLAKVYDKQGNKTAAKEGYQKVRTLVRNGFPDPLGLAINSYGEEARIHYKASDYSGAFALYGKQVSFGSISGIDSLQLLLSILITETDEVIERTTNDALSRNLIILYAYSYLHHSIDDHYTSQGIQQHKANRKLEENILSFVVKKTLQQSKKNSIFQLKAAGWLAANRYIRGDFELASQLVQFDQSAVSQWIKAKLALRKEDLNQAQEALSKAISLFPITDDKTAYSTGNYTRLNAEYAILQLSRKDYLNALTVFYTVVNNNKDLNDSMSYYWVNYWPDTAYVAERVLTVRELKTFVDQNAPATPQIDIDSALKKNNKVPAVALRAVLARRMLRNNQLEEAIEYFDDKTLRSIAERYIDAVQRANSQWSTSSTKAEAWYNAALIAKKNGLEILGFALSPDHAIVDGMYNQWGKPHTSNEISPFLSRNEHRRCNQSVAKPNLRFHYRLIASDYMLKAANLVPQSSQAFVALLCEATGWNNAMYPEHTQVLYQKYIKEGAYVPWAAFFGTQCEKPDFSSATTRVWEERYAKINNPIIYWGTGLFILFILAYLSIKIRFFNKK